MKKLIILSLVVFAAVGLVFFVIAKSVKADNKFKVVHNLIDYNFYIFSKIHCTVFGYKDHVF